MKPTYPPRLLLRFLKWFCDEDLHASIEGDLLELYQEKVQTHGKVKADLSFFKEVLLLIRPGIVKTFYFLKNSKYNFMLRNNIRSSVRGIRKHKVFASINILGLSLGLAIALMTTLFILDETSYDTFHTDGDRIYRITKSYFNGDQTVNTVPFRSYLLGHMAEQIPGIQSTTTLASLGDRLLLTIDGDQYPERRISLADSNFFDFFSFKLIEGNPQSILSHPSTVVLSKSKALQYFKDGSPIGKTISLENSFEGEPLELTIAGVFEDMPHNSHFHYDFLVSMPTVNEVANKLKVHGLALKYGYIKLLPGYDISEVDKLIPAIEKEHAPDFYADYDMHLHPQPLYDIHLKSNMENEMEVNGDINRLYMFGGIALLTLIIAAFNYINLVTSRAELRAKEVGVRKTIGALRQQLITQFLTESMLMVMLALLIACIVVNVSLSYFNAFTGKELIMDLTNLKVTGTFLLIGILVGLLSGIYPALVLTGITPAQVLKSSGIKQGRSQLLRKTLIVSQFTISSILIIITLVVYSQWEMMRSLPYTFKPEELVNIPVTSSKIRDHYFDIKKELVQNSNVKMVTGGKKNFIAKLKAFNGLTIPGHDGYVDMYYTAIDTDFFDIYGKKLIQGRNFEDNAKDAEQAIILNRAATQLIGKSVDDIIGMKIKVYDGYSPEVIGVVEDFQFQSIHGKTVPMYFQLVRSKGATEHLNVITLWLNTGNLSNTMASIESVFKKFDEEALFDYSFLDYDIQKAYEQEEKFASIFSLASILAIFIAAIGIYGLTATITHERRKEISLRKIMGANALSITALVNTVFLRLVVIAGLIAFPLAYFLVQFWLQNFSQQVEIGLSTFVITSLISFGVVTLGSAYWSLKVALANPVDSLR